MCNEFLSRCDILLLTLLSIGLVLGLVFGVAYFIDFLIDLKTKIEHLKYTIGNEVLHVDSRVNSKLNNLNNMIESLELYQVKLNKRSKK